MIVPMPIVPLPGASPFDRRVIGVGGVVFVVLMALSARYGFHRDELYMLDCARHLQASYVDQPVLAPLLAWVSLKLFGVSVTGLRLWPALAAWATLQRRAHRALHDVRDLLRDAGQLAVHAALAEQLLRMRLLEVLPADLDARDVRRDRQHRHPAIALFRPLRATPLGAAARVGRGGVIGYSGKIKVLTGLCAGRFCAGRPGPLWWSR